MFANINCHLVFSVNYYFNLCVAELLPVFSSVQTEHIHRERELVFLFKGKTRANVSVNNLDALVFKRSVAVKNLKLEHEMWVNDRVARQPVVLTSRKRERCHYFLNSTFRCFSADLN